MKNVLPFCSLSAKRWSVQLNQYTIRSRVAAKSSRRMRHANGQPERSLGGSGPDFVCETRSDPVTWYSQLGTVKSATDGLPRVGSARYARTISASSGLGRAGPKVRGVSDGTSSAAGVRRGADRDGVRIAPVHQGFSVNSVPWALHQHVVCWQTASCRGGACRVLRGNIVATEETRNGR